MMPPKDRRELSRVLEEIIEQMLPGILDVVIPKILEQSIPGILDRHAERRNMFETQAGFLTPAEIAKKTGKSRAQVHFWLREGRLIGEHRDDVVCGAHTEWRVSHAEWLRFRDEGLYPRYSVESFATKLQKIKKDISLNALCAMVESWCKKGLIRAKKCPHGWRILGSELKRCLDRGLLTDNDAA
ncbi:MAG TPA: hypothetical protein VMF30_13645 [Pirellulales bacterium]|nr:hypothetical protein [Pirellulales bacterium]